MFANDDNDRRKATARHVELMAETNVSAYVASKPRIGTGKVLTKNHSIVSANTCTISTSQVKIY
jgi:hypothetical protein